MKNIKILFTAFAALIVASTAIFYGCSEEEYNFNNIEPVIMTLTGPVTGVPAHGLSEYPFKYQVPARGGSTFDWSFDNTKWGGTITQDPNKPYIAYVVFTQSSADTAAIIKVVETTQGGKTSPVKQLRVDLIEFCPYDMDYWVGEIEGTSSRNDDVMIGTRTANLNELKVKGLAGFINFSWGENWVEGDGTALLEFSCGNNVVIKNQWIGTTDYPDDYYIEGTGTIDETAKTITLNFRVLYTGGATGFAETILTKKGAKWVVKDNLKVPTR